MQERRKLKEIEDRERLLREEDAAVEEQERLREERRRIKRESEEQRVRIEQERKESEERERLERMRIQREEQSKRENEKREEEEREEQERKQQKEIENQVEKERIRREEEARKAREEADKLANSEAEKERQRQKELLLARMKAIDDKKDNSAESLSPTARNKSYTFTRPVENLHQGIPAHDEIPSSRKSTKPTNGFLDDIGSGYQPTFNTAPKTTTKRNTNLMNDLFGASDSNKAPKDSLEDDMFGSKNNLGSGNRRNATESDEPSVSRFSSGGGGGLNNDSRQPTPPNGNPNHLLPRRTRQGHISTFQSRPTVNAIDDIDDDLEEMTL